MQMGAVDVVGFRAEHRCEFPACSLVHAPEELGLRQCERVGGRRFALGPGIVLDERGRLDRGLDGGRAFALAGFAVILSDGAP